MQIICRNSDIGEFVWTLPTELASAFQAAFDEKNCHGAKELVATGEKYVIASITTTVEAFLKLLIVPMSFLANQDLTGFDLAETLLRNLESARIDMRMQAEIDGDLDDDEEFD